jgi:putative peptidoglycan lipid II flippase
LRFDRHHPALRQIFAAFLPITALSVIAQINLVVDRSMASALPTGSIGALSYADTVLGIFYMVGISLGIAVFPSLSRMAAINDAASTARTIVSSIRLLIFVLTPITLLVILFGSPLVGLILGRGRFDAVAVQMTADALGAYAVGLIAIAAIYVLQRAFFAMTDNLVPFLVGFGAAIFHIGLNWLFMQPWAHAGIALSTSITALATAVVLLIFLARRLPEISLGALALYQFRCALLAAPAVALAFGVYTWLVLSDSSFSSRVLGVSLAGLGGVVYIALALATRTHESELVLQLTRQFLGRFSKRD